MDVQRICNRCITCKKTKFRVVPYGLYILSHPPESSTSRRHFFRSEDLILGSFCCEKGSRHLVLWSLGNLTGLSEILRQGTGCVKGRF